MTASALIELHCFNHSLAVPSARSRKGCNGTAAPGNALDAAEGLPVSHTMWGVPDLKWLRDHLEKNKFNDDSDNDGTVGGNNAIGRHGYVDQSKQSQRGLAAP